ncbi:hypothetical protein NC652_012353 [Populus alba x Populus x berolinensis]|nr:hypothetical protein NC652_012353 [Populus alba x Populus x berolinensis]
MPKVRMKPESSYPEGWELIEPTASRTGWEDEKEKTELDPHGRQETIRNEISKELYDVLLWTRPGYEPIVLSPLHPAQGSQLWHDLCVAVVPKHLREEKVLLSVRAIVDVEACASGGLDCCFSSEPSFFCYNLSANRKPSYDPYEQAYVCSKATFSNYKLKLMEIDNNLVRTRIVEQTMQNLLPQTPLSSNTQLSPPTSNGKNLRLTLVVWAR